jgi:acetyl-CoA carboxylase carboxyltransferase component
VRLARYFVHHDEVVAAAWRNSLFALALVASSWAVFRQRGTYDNSFLPACLGLAMIAGLAYQEVWRRAATSVLVAGRRIRGSFLFGAVASLVVATIEEATDTVTDLLAFLPSCCDVEPDRRIGSDPADRLTPEAGETIPASLTGSYDVRKVISAFVDDHEYLELRARWAANIVTAFAHVDGRPVGLIANQPTAIAGTLDIPASQKGARFVAMCDAFNLPIITLVDTPGFYPGKDLEWRGMIRHGAQLAFAYARATVPRVCLTLRKSYGGAYIVMDSKRMGNDLSLAWPGAEIAVMGAKGAAEILHRRATAEERAALEAAYEERLLNPYIAAERGYIDAVIDPVDTRAEISAALEALSTKREHLVARKHGNTPL